MSSPSAANAESCGPLDCSVCFEAYDNSMRTPKKLLTCGHTFCSDCIIRMIAGAYIPIPCPWCRVRFTRSDVITNNGLAQEVAAAERDAILVECKETPLMTCSGGCGDRLLTEPWRVYICLSCDSSALPKMAEDPAAARRQLREQVFCSHCAEDHAIEHQKQSLLLVMKPLHHLIAYTKRQVEFVLTEQMKAFIAEHEELSSILGKEACDRLVRSFRCDLMSMACILLHCFHRENEEGCGHAMTPGTADLNWMQVFFKQLLHDSLKRQVLDRGFMRMLDMIMPQLPAVTKSRLESVKEEEMESESEWTTALLNVIRVLLQLSLKLIHDEFNVANWKVNFRSLLPEVIPSFVQRLSHPSQRRFEIILKISNFAATFCSADLTMSFLRSDDVVLLKKMLEKEVSSIVEVYTSPSASQDRRELSAWTEQLAEYQAHFTKLAPESSSALMK